MRKIVHDVIGLDLTEWAWPDFDVNLIKVIDQVQDVHEILKHVTNRRVCIQAGGACGVWPKMFARYFESVITFEPEPGNWRCLKQNCTGSNIVALNQALGEHAGTVDMALPESMNENAGTWYATPGLSTELTTIDETCSGDVDLIQLDVEGMEIDALKGAAETIRRDSPIIVIEEKPLPHKSRPCDDARRWLESEFGYGVIGRVHRDVIMTRRSSTAHREVQ